MRGNHVPRHPHNVARFDTKSSNIGLLAAQKKLYETDDEWAAQSGSAVGMPKGADKCSLRALGRVGHCLALVAAT